MAFLGGYGNRVKRPLPFIGNLVDNLFEPLFDVAPHGRHVDFMPIFILKNSLSKSLRSIERLCNAS
jgi:hypothetical protein